MIPRKHKLTGKEINYMLRKWKRIHGNVFTYLIVDQYRNKTHHQRWVHISIKISKKATMRNQIKRLIYSAVKEKYWTSRHYKIFISINKKFLPQIISSLERLEKTAILNYRKKQIQSDLHMLSKKWV